MAKIPTILEAGRADGKLIKTNSVYDDNQEKFLSDKIKNIDDNHNELKDKVNTLTETVSNNESDIESKLEKEKTRATNAESVLNTNLEAEKNRATIVEDNLKETINNITEINKNATAANIVTIDPLPNSTASNVQQALDDLYENMIYDVSARNGGIVFDSLQALLSSSNLHTFIPTSVRYGGITIRFIQSFDNKYIQYRYLLEYEDTTAGNNAFKNITNWKIDDDSTLTGYFICDTFASIAAKVVEAPNYILTDGGSIKVKFNKGINSDVIDAITLNINNTGPKPLVLNGVQASPTNNWTAGSIIDLYYDGTYNDNNGAWIGRTITTSKDLTIFNISSYTGNYYDSIGGNGNAASAVPYEFRKDGLKIDFKTNNGEWKEYQYNNSSIAESNWIDESYWKNCNVHKYDIIVSTSNNTMVAKVADFTLFKLENGVYFRLILIKGNGAENATLNINGTGAYPLFYNGKQTSSTNPIPNNEVLDCYFDGTNYQAVSVFDVDDPSVGGSQPLSANGGKILYDENIRQEKNYGPNNLVKLTFTAGGYIKTNVAQVSTNEGVPVVITNGNYCYSITACSAGDTFIINGTGGGSSRAWAFTDSEWNVLKVSSVDIICTDVVLVAPPNAAYIILNDGTRKGYSYKGISLYSSIKNDIYRNRKDYNYDLSTKSFNYQQRCLHHDNFYREVTRADKWKIGENYGTMITYQSPRSDYASVDDGFRINTKYLDHSTEGGVLPIDDKYPHQVISGYLTNNQNVSISKAFRLIYVPGVIVKINGVNTIINANYDKKFVNKIIETSVPSLGKYAEVVFNFVDEENYDSFEVLYDTFTENETEVNKIVINFKRTILGFTQTNEFYSTTRPATTFDIVYVDGNLRLYLDYVNIYTYIDDVPKALIETLFIDVNKRIGIAISTAHIYEYRIFNLFGIDEKITLSAEESGYVCNGIPMRYSIQKTYDYQYQYGKILRISGVGNDFPNVVDYQYNAKYINIKDNKIYTNNSSQWVDTGETINSYLMYYDTYNKKLYTYDNGSLVLQSDEPQSIIPYNTQRFEVRANATMGSEQARCELIRGDEQRMWNLNLKKRKVSFSILLPASYLADDATPGEGEALLQFQASVDGGKTRQPIFTIASSVIGEGENAKVRYHLNRRYIPTKPVPTGADWNEFRYGEDDVDLGEAKLGHWETFEVYYKEGYMKEHFPVLIVKRNGEVLYNCVLENTYNTMTGSYIRYGVYKSVYRHTSTTDRDADNRKRIVYIANFEEEV